MDAGLRPHRGGTVLALGILSLVAALFLLPLGIVAWILGSKDLKAMDRGSVDPAGRSLTGAGRLLGILATAAWVPWLAIVGLISLITMIGRVASHEYANDALRKTKVYYSRSADESRPSTVEFEYMEARQADGTWVKSGLSVRWSRDRRKLEEGSYRDGERDGHWTFWSDDGSVDKERSGEYQDDVRIGPSPMGDFPVDEDH